MNTNDEVGHYVITHCCVNYDTRLRLRIFSVSNRLGLQNGSSSAIESNIVIVLECFQGIYEVSLIIRVCAPANYFERYKCCMTTDSDRVYY